MNSPVGIISNNSNKNNSIETETEQITEVINQEWDHRTNIDGTGQAKSGRSTDGHILNWTVYKIEIECFFTF